jgi:DNA repair ATPase RecN
MTEQTSQQIIDNQATKIDTQRDKIDDKNSEIQKLHDRMELLDASDRQNAVEHKQLFETLEKIDKKLDPISETYRTVGLMAKWVMALLVFLSVLGGVIWTWMSIFMPKK